MTFALHLCTEHHVESGVSAWLGSTLCLVFDHGKSTLCLVFDHGKSTLCLVFDHGKSTLCLVFDVCREDMVNRHCVGVRCML